ncbi:MAG: hypothetical protein ACRD15_01405 [Vicinamibacterales bacterium]
MRTGVPVLAIAALAAGACANSPSPYVVTSEVAPDRAHVAAVRLIACGSEWCDSLWLGPNAESATLIATLPYATERATEIAWLKDAKRVAFLINGYQLRLYEAQTRTPAGQFDLIPPDTQPTTRIARGVTFSDNGAAITFDDCPRDRSGCRPGLVGVGGYR